MAHDEAGHAGEGVAGCQACPICMGLAVLRQARPEAVQHLAKAGAELLLAARAVLEGAGPRPAAPGGNGRPSRPEGMQRIDIG
jgi:hypothetical protein